MNPTTYETINSRLQALELQLGITKKDPRDPQDLRDPLVERDAVVTRISRLHAKIDSVYANNPELQHVPGVMKQFQRPGNKTIKLIEGSAKRPDTSSDEANEEVVNAKAAAVPEKSPVDDLTKQELILIKHQQLVNYCSNLKELSTMEIPVLTSEAYKGLDPSLVLERKHKIKAVAREFDLLMAKHLLILEKYSALISTQSRFWKLVHDRLRKATTATNATVRGRQTKYKY